MTKEETVKYKKCVEDIQRAASLWDAAAQQQAFTAIAHSKTDQSRELLTEARIAVARMEACHSLESQCIQFVRLLFD